MLKNIILFYGIYTSLQCVIGAALVLMLQKDCRYEARLDDFDEPFRSYQR